MKALYRKIADRLNDFDSFWGCALRGLIAIVSIIILALAVIFLGILFVKLISYVWPWIGYVFLVVIFILLLYAFGATTEL